MLFILFVPPLPSGSIVLCVRLKTLNTIVYVMIYLWVNDNRTDYSEDIVLYVDSNSSDSIIIR